MRTHILQTIIGDLSGADKRIPVTNSAECRQNGLASPLQQSMCFKIVPSNQRRIGRPPIIVRGTAGFSEIDLDIDL